jgi:hypothetical protein
VGTEHVLNFCSDDEDSALDPSNVISSTPSGIELLRLVWPATERTHRILLGENVFRKSAASESYTSTKLE